MDSVIEFSKYGEIDLDQDPIIVLPCQHFFTKNFLDENLEIGDAYKRDKDGKFIQGLPSGEDLDVQLKQCPYCRMPISGIQRYNRVLKRAVLNTMLKSLIIRSEQKYKSIFEELDAFERKLQETRQTSLDTLQNVRHPRQRQRISARNRGIISKRIDSSEELKAQIKSFRRDVEEKNQPHVRVYSMSIDAKSRAKAQDTGQSVVWPMDVPKPQIKHRLMADVLTLRLYTLLYSDMMDFLDRLASTGCQEEAKHLYKDTINKCNKVRKIADIHKTESDKGHYYPTTVDIILLQTQLVILEIRACREASDPSKLQQLRDSGLNLLEDCGKNFQKYASTRKFEPIATRLRDALTSGFFNLAVSMEERREIVRAMNTELRGTGHWYQCRNGHPVILLIFLLISL